MQVAQRLPPHDSIPLSNRWTNREGKSGVGIVLKNVYQS